MAHPREEELLASLPSEIAKSLRVAIAHLGDEDWQPSYQAFGEALAAAHYPQDSPTWPLPSELTREQRAIAEIAAYRPFNTTPYPLPTMESARRWLGLDPPTLLETEMVEWEGQHEPLWRVLQRTNRSMSYKQQAALLDALPVEKALWVFEHGGVDQDTVLKDGRLLLRVAKSTDAIEKWAVETANRLAATGGVHDLLPYLAFAAIVGAGITVEPRWDVLLPLGYASLLPQTVLNVRAIPQTRRLDAVLAALDRTIPLGMGSPAALAMDLLPELPRPELALVVVRALEGGRLSAPEAAELEARLRAVAKTLPILADVASALGEPVTLTLLSVTKPKASRVLTDVQRQQLELAGREYDTKDLPAAKRVGIAELRVVGDESQKPTFDVWLYRVDSGLVFASGTTDRIGALIQNEIELTTKNRALLSALRKVIWGKPIRKPKK